VVALIICFVAFWRNNLIYKYRLRALNTISQKAEAAADRREEWHFYYYKFDEYGTYSEMLFDITRWRYRSFFPDI